MCFFESTATPAASPRYMPVGRRRKLAFESKGMAGGSCCASAGRAASIPAPISQAFIWSSLCKLPRQGRLRPAALPGACRHLRRFGKQRKEPVGPVEGSPYKSVRRGASGPGPFSAAPSLSSAANRWEAPCHRPSPRLPASARPAGLAVFPQVFIIPRNPTPAPCQGKQGFSPRLMQDDRAQTGRTHPGAGKRRAAATPKGRQVDPQALAEIEDLLWNRPRSRDLLIEHLHLVQDKYGQISAAHLAALCELMGLAFAEGFETATFYAHFDVVKEGEAALAPTVIRVCDSLSCALFGAEALLAELQSMAQAGRLGPGPEGAVRVVRAPCVGLCDQAPAVEVGHHFLHRAKAADVAQAVARGDTHPHMPSDTIDYDQYVAGGGYTLLAELRSGKRDAESFLKILDDSGLRGLGGAGFPT